MSNEKYTSKQGASKEEEYQFADEDFSGGLEAPEDVAQAAPVAPQGGKLRGLLPMIKKYRIIVVVILLILAIAILRLVTGGKEKAPTMQQATTQPAVVTTDTTAPKQQQEVLETLFKKDVDVLAEKTTADAKQIAQLQQQVNRLTLAVNRSNQALATLQSSLATMQADIKAVQAQQAALAKPAKKTVVAVKLPEKIKYTVRAVVPGRAWLQSSQGLTQSVTVGDVVPGYGRVTRINPEKGLVLLSSGSRFGYGEDDS